MALSALAELFLSKGFAALFLVVRHQSMGVHSRHFCQDFMRAEITL